MKKRRTQRSINLFYKSLNFFKLTKDLNKRTLLTQNMQIEERNVQEIGKSSLISLPKEWTRRLGVHKGSKLKILVADDGTLIIAPEIQVQKERKEAIIVYDEHFQRRFFREYFQGDSKIVIKTKEKLSEKERQDVYNFLKRFMNIQIIEEDKEKIVLKVFKIDELTIEECLKRMYFLSITLLEAGKEERLQKEEWEQTLSRFYYMLVMQARRYLEEGKYTEKNNISLIRVLDCRMVAEKIMRITKYAPSLEQVKKEDKEKIKKYYQEAFDSFISNNFEKAVPLWKKGNELSFAVHAIKASIETQAHLQILQYAKEISMLVR